MRTVLSSQAPSGPALPRAQGIRINSLLQPSLGGREQSWCFPTPRPPPPCWFGLFSGATEEPLSRLHLPPTVSNLFPKIWNLQSCAFISLTKISICSYKAEI